MLQPGIACTDDSRDRRTLKEFCGTVGHNPAQNKDHLHLQL